MVSILPNQSLSAEEAVVPVGEAPLYQLHGVAHREWRRCAENQMHMVWHDNPGVKFKVRISPDLADDIQEHPNSCRGAKDLLPVGRVGGDE
jgi:hypothetical protein